MRDIKFRAWDKKYQKMHEGGDIRVALAYPDDDVEFMQYTGLKDKNGTEIYEGDVLAWSEVSDFDNEWDNKGVIKFHAERGYPAFDVDPTIDCESNGLSYIMATCECEVIGNIYENGDLLDD